MRSQLAMPAAIAVLLFGACQPQEEGILVTGAVGERGAAGCTPAAGEIGIGLSALVSVTEPANGRFFTPGEAMQILIRFADRCNQTVAATDLELANLYITGPKLGLKTKTAAKLLNCMTDRSAPDDQHHFVNLQDPRFKDVTQQNFGQAEDGSIVFSTAPVSDEEPGTYTVGVWARTSDEIDQVFGSASFQIGTEAREEYTTGRPGVAPACGRCHWGPATGKINMGNAFPTPGASSGDGARRLTGHLPAPVYGNWILDQTPIETCQHCHNLDSYSPNPFAQKIHAVHRGHRMVKPVVAHPEIPEMPGGVPADPTLAHYTNVHYPSKPDGEKDCTLCHVDDRWKTAPSALACNGCHEALDLKALTLSPPRLYGKLGAPPGVACKSDQACVEAFGKAARCELSSGDCRATTHPALDNKTCAECHTPDAPGDSPISSRHEIKLRTQSKGIVFGGVAIAGGTGPSGSFLPGDTLAARFTLADNAGNPIDLSAKNPATGAYVYAVDAVVGGPTENRQRLAGPFGQAALRAALSRSGGTWTLELALPENGLSLPPLNTAAPGPRSTRGTYSVHLYAGYNPGHGLLGGAAFESGSAVVDFHYCPSASDCPDEALRPRQVVLRTACQGCHTLVTAHGGLRTDPESCSLCHTRGATDRPAGSQGAPCAENQDCGGYSAGASSWEECQDVLGADGKTPGADGVPDTCVMTRSPTGPAPIEFTSLIHSIHYARRRGDYVKPPLLSARVAFIGHKNSVNDFSDRLFPMDMRNCTRCHADSGDPCSEADDVCGFGQACSRGRCVNVSWRKDAGGAPCLACHNTSHGYAHVELNTTDDGVESCGACHGENRQFSPEKVHRIGAPYVPPYPRSASSGN
jgi:hypothetical protein